jgi:GTP cyclohydrolase IA
VAMDLKKNLDIIDRAINKGRMVRGGFVEPKEPSVGLVPPGEQLLTNGEYVEPRNAHEEVIRSLLGGIIGEDVNREGLLETPARVVKAWKHWCGGYQIDVKQLIKAFSDGAENADEMVVRKAIRIYSHCEHHLAPIIGDCTIAYIPNGKVIGLSKLDRVADAFARRLQVQERLTSQIADALWEGLEPLGVGVYINARHMCIESRGVMQHNSDTATTALRGVMKTSPEARAEFLALTR